MAKSTKNTDLVPQDALKQLMELDAQLETTKNNLRELLVPVTQVSNELAKSATNYKTLTDLINKLNEAEKGAGDTYKGQKKILSDMEKAQKNLADAQSEQGKQIALVREQTRQMNQQNKIAAKEALAVAGSLNEMRAKLEQMKFTLANYMKVGSEEYEKMKIDIQKLTAEISKQEQSIGVWGRNVGNYGSAFNGLRFNIQQVARELPSLTISASQFFLAISNNLPMLVDELQRAREANKAMRAEGQKTVPVWKQVASGIVSWQTALVVGITLLTAYGKDISNWVKGLFGAKQALIETSEITRSFGSNIAKDSAELDIMFARLKEATKGTEEYEKARRQIIDKYGDYLKGQKDEIRNLEDLDEAYKVLTKSIIANSIQRGLQDANSKAIENYEKQMDKALDGVEEKFIKKFGKETGYDKFLTFKVGIASDDDELRDEAIQIYQKFNEVKTRYRANGYYSETVNPLAGVREDIEDAVSGLQDAKNEIVETEKSFKRIYGINEDNSDAMDSLIKKQQDLREEAERMSETTEEEIKLKNQRLKQIDDEISRLQNLGIESEEQAKEREKTEREQEKEEEKLAKYVEKLRLNEINAYNQLQALKIKGGIESNKLIVQNERASYEERIEALNEYTDALKKSVSESADAQIDRLIRNTGKELGLNPDDAKERVKLEEELSNQILLIRQKGALEIEKIEAESSKMQVKIEEDRVKNIIDIIARETDARQKALSGSEMVEFGELAKEYASGLIAEEAYQSKKKAISDKYTMARFDLENEMLQQSLAKTIGDEQARLDIQKKIADNRLEYEKYINEQEIAAAEELANKKKELLQSVFDFGNQLIENRFEKQQQELEDELEANEDWEDDRLAQIERLEESGAITKEQAEARKQVVQDQTALKEQEIERKQAELQRKQAVYEKSMTIAKIAFNTALGISAAWSNPFTAPAMIPLIIAAGAVQTATVLATPIPEYAKGTDDHPGGLAIVGDAGKSEMVIANGKIFKTPATDTLVELPKHSIVYPDFNDALVQLPKMTKFEEHPIDLSRLESSSVRLESQSAENNRLLRNLITRMEINARNEVYARELNRLRCSKR